MQCGAVRCSIVTFPHNQPRFSLVRLIIATNHTPASLGIRNLCRHQIRNPKAPSKASPRFRPSRVRLGYRWISSSKP